MELQIGQDSVQIMGALVGTVAQDMDVMVAMVAKAMDVPAADVPAMGVPARAAHLRDAPTQDAHLATTITMLVIVKPATQHIFVS